jgi:hypothetical protein
LQESASVVHAKIDSVVHADDGDDGDDDDEHDDDDDVMFLYFLSFYIQYIGIGGVAFGVLSHHISSYRHDVVGFIPQTLWVKSPFIAYCVC